MKHQVSLIILCLCLLSCKKEGNTRIKEIEVLRYGRACTDTIWPIFYISFNYLGEALAVSGLQESKFVYGIFKLHDMPMDNVFKHEEGIFKENLPSIQGSMYCLNVIYNDDSSKVIYIDDDKVYSNSSLLKFTENVASHINLKRKIKSDRSILNTKMKRFINFVVHNDSTIFHSPPPPPKIN